MSEVLNGIQVLEQKGNAKPARLAKKGVVAKPAPAPETPAAPVETAETAKQAAPETASAKAASVAVYDKNDNFVRSYNEVNHGEGYKALAKQFALKIGGKVQNG